MNPLISLVIPVYNVEKYLDKCMESVLAQTYDNFEVILVDDGSTDNSGKMCDEYAKRDSRVIVYHKPNGGLSDARNFGVEHCNADLVSFIDSDDYVTEDYLEYLWYLMNKYDSDVSSANYYRIQEGDRKDYSIDANFQLNDYSISKSEAITKLLYGVKGFGTSACIKLYKKELLYLFPFPYKKQPEDVAVMYKIIWKSNRVAIGTKSIYRYVQRNTSYVHSTLTDKKVNDLIEIMRDMEKFVKENSLESVKAFDKRCCFLFGEYMPAAFYDRKSKNNYCSLQKQLKNYYRNLKNNDNNSVLFRIKIRILLLNFNLARIIWPIAEKINWLIKERKKV